MRASERAGISRHYSGNAKKVTNKPGRQRGIERGKCRDSHTLTRSHNK